MRVSVPAAAAGTPAADAPRPPAPGAAGRSLLDGALALAVLALAFLVASFPAANADLWLHLASGRLVAHGDFPFGRDPFSALDPAPAWTNHAWLADLLLYALYQVGGGAALVVAKAVLVTLLAGVLLRLRRPGGSLGLPAAATGLVVLALMPALVLRPAVVSYLLFAVLLVLLHRRPRGAARWRLPLAVGVLFALWVNLDGGALAGLLLLALWLVGGLLQRAAPLGAADDPVEEPHPPAALALALAAALAGCLVSPYLYRTFTLPSEFAPLSRALPDALRRDPLFEALFRSPFSRLWWLQTGPVAAVAYYLLLGLGLASFALNTGGWRWPRVLAWLAFVWLSSTYWRLLPYFAVLAGPVLVLNVQAFAARRAAAQTQPLPPSAVHARAFLAGTGRVLALAVGLVLLALAWPGWLGGGDAAARAARRVGWHVAPDPTQERLAKRLAGWYDVGLLRRDEARGLHISPEFAYYCAWFCPAEKAVFDTRLTALAKVTGKKVIGDVVNLRKDLLAQAAPPGRDPAERPPVPDDLLRDYGITHLVAAGRVALEGGLARVLFAEPGRWPVWAIEGRGVIAGRRDPARPGDDPYPNLRLDPVWLAVGTGAAKLPPPPEGFPPPPPEPSLWQSYRFGPPQVPTEAYEAALWMVYREMTDRRFNRAVLPWQVVTALGRGAPLWLPDLITWRLDPRVLTAPWQHSPDGRAARAAGLLAVRAARRATRAGPDAYEGYLRLAEAYGGLESDAGLRRLQQVAALRQALERLPLARAAGQPTDPDEFHVQDLLFNLYRQSAVPLSNNTPPGDLMLEARERQAELFPLVVTRLPAPASAQEAEARAKALDEQYKKLQQDTDNLRREVKRRRDDLENAAAKLQPPDRAVLACRYGLAREALAALRDIDPQALNNPNAAANLLHLTLELMLLAGDAEGARTLLLSDKLSPVTVLPPMFQPAFRALHVRAAAALGDYGAALNHLADSLRTFPRAAGPVLAEALLTLIAPDVLPGQPLTRVLTSPYWGGLWLDPQRRQFRPGAVEQLYGAVIQQSDLRAQAGLLALEQGDVVRARQELTQALATAGPFPFNLRAAALDWLELFGK
jgi:hypothetical protein